LFLRAIPAACIARTVPASSSFRGQYALKWLNRRQLFLKRITVFVLFAFFITAAPICAEGQVCSTCTVIVV
jgi:hypothetical protein